MPLGEEEDVPGGQVTVDQLAFLQVAHGVSYLAGVGVHETQMDTVRVGKEVVPKVSKGS